MYRNIRQRLAYSGMEAGEARAVALLLMEKICGMDTAAALLAPADWGREDGSHVEEGKRLSEAVDRVANGEPVQYVLGEADFCGMALHVEKGVLIPRAETEELARWAAEDSKAKHVLDIGTGSGCIAVALARMLPEAQVEAWDVSDVALRIARGNACDQNVRVLFRHVDVLKEGEAEAERLTGTMDTIVSNPPYICHEEAADMEANVLDHEPHLALFVPDDDPLLFYRQIARLALTMLRKDGRLFFEINRRFGKETADMLAKMGYREIIMRQDQFGNDRMILAHK